MHDPIPSRDPFADEIVRVFQEWQQIDEEYTSRDDPAYQRADWAWEGARSAAVTMTPASAAHAAIVALIAYDEANTLLDNMNATRPNGRAADHGDALRMIADGALAAWRYLDANGGEAARPIADWHGLLPKPARDAENGEATHG